MAQADRYMRFPPVQARMRIKHAKADIEALPHAAVAVEQSSVLL